MHSWRRPLTLAAVAAAVFLGGGGGAYGATLYSLVVGVNVPGQVQCIVENVSSSTASVTIHLRGAGGASSSSSQRQLAPGGSTALAATCSGNCPAPNCAFAVNLDKDSFRATACLKASSGLTCLPAY